MFLARSVPNPKVVGLWVDLLVLAARVVDALRVPVAVRWRRWWRVATILALYTTGHWQVWSRSALAPT